MEERSEMVINDDELLRILKLMEESDWDEIELTTKNLKFIVGKNLPPDYGGSSAHTLNPPPARAEKMRPADVATYGSGEAAMGHQPKAQMSDTPEKDTEANGTPAKAPMMGTFYRAPSPGAPPFIEVGDTVSEHSIIGIIEVMKVMSSVEAGLRGRVSSILVENGQLVQYNQPLLLIDSEEPHTETTHE